MGWVRRERGSGRGGMGEGLVDIHIYVFRCILKTGGYYNKGCMRRGEGRACGRGEGREEKGEIRREWGE